MVHVVAVAAAVAVGVVEHGGRRRDAQRRRRDDTVDGTVSRQPLLLHQLTDDGLYRLRRLRFNVGI